MHSIEYDKDSVALQFALEWLKKKRKMFNARFGDSRKLIPELVEDGDIVLHQLASQRYGRIK